MKKCILIFITGVAVGITTTLIVKRAQKHNGKPPVSDDKSNQVEGIKQTS